jgi:hypothetical protein
MTQFFPVLQEEASELQRLRFQVAVKTALCDPTPQFTNWNFFLSIKIPLGELIYPKKSTDSRKK